jgi:hypothetical protein
VLSLAQRHLLDQHGLDETIGRFRIVGHAPADELIRTCVFGLGWCLLQTSKDSVMSCCS